MSDTKRRSITDCVRCIHVSGRGSAWWLGDLRNMGIVPHTISVANPLLDGGVDLRLDDWQPISVVDLETTARVNDMTYHGISQDGTAHILSAK